MSGLDAIHAYIRRILLKRRDVAVATDEEILHCRALDSSDNGMKLSWSEGGVGDARVGDLLGLLDSEGSRQTLRLAIIRSVRVYREGGMEIGVQLLAGELGAVSCSLPGQADSDAVHALFMAADEKQQLATTLIAAKGLYEHGRVMTIDAGGREVSVRAGRRVFNSPVFDRFEFSAQ